jgi:hypothetical protein
MVVCDRCGVEVDESASLCPLCGSGLEGTAPETLADQANRQILSEFADEIKPLSTKQRARLTWEISTAMLFSAVAVVLFVDFLANRRITWSVYPIIVTGSVWVLAGLVSFLYKHPVLVFFGSFLDVLAMEFLVDIASQRLPWFIQLGLPITACLYLILGILGLISPRINRRGLNIPAFFLIGMGIFIMGIEATIDWYLWKHVVLSWSALAAISVSPVAVILIFVHYRLRKYVDLKRFFHL